MQTQIVDIDGERISNLDLAEIEYEAPFIINDILKGKNKVPEIRVYQDLDILKELQFFVYGKELNEDERWAKRQKYSIHLRPAEAPVEKTFKKMLRLPAKHYIEVDTNNSKLRIVGDFVDLKERGFQEY